MFIVDKKMVEYTTKFEKDIAEEIIHSWMNEREVFWIDHYGTYENGLNYTRGGQCNASLAWVQSSEKKRRLRFKDVLMPLFREYAREHDGGCADIPQNDPRLGYVTSSIRYGDLKVPLEFHHELFDVLQFKMDNRLKAHSRQSFDLFAEGARWWREHRGHDLSTMPRNATIPDEIERIGGMKVGEDLHKYRCGIKGGGYKDILDDEECAKALQNLNFTETTILSEEKIRQRQSQSRTNALFEKMVPLLQHVFNERGHICMKRREPNPSLPDHLQIQLSKRKECYQIEALFFACTHSQDQMLKWSAGRSDSLFFYAEISTCGYIGCA